MPPRNLAEVFGQSLSQFAVDFPRFAQLKQQESQLQEQREFNRQTTLANLGLSEAAGGRAERGLGLQEERFGLEQQRFEAGQQQEPLTESQQFDQFLQQNPEAAQRLFQARISEAELKGQPKPEKPEKGPSLSERLKLGGEQQQSKIRQLSGDVMERFEALDPALVDELIGGGDLPSEDPAILGSLSRQFLGKKDKPYWFTGDTTITDPTLEAKLDTLGQVFEAPAIQPELGSPAMEKWIKQAYPSRWRGLSLEAKQKLFSKYGPG